MILKLYRRSFIIEIYCLNRLKRFYTFNSVKTRIWNAFKKVTALEYAEAFCLSLRRGDVVRINGRTVRDTDLKLLCNPNRIGIAL